MAVGVLNNSLMVGLGFLPVNKRSVKVFWYGLMSAVVVIPVIEVRALCVIVGWRIGLKFWDVTCSMPSPTRREVHVHFSRDLSPCLRCSFQ